MASESTDEGVVAVELSPELDEWLDERARELGESREELVTQLLAAYRTTTTERDGGDLAAALDVEGRVEEAMQDELDTAVAAAVDDALAERVDSTVRDRLPDITDAVESRVEGRLDDVEDGFQEKLTDVRQRVVQLKRELDGKAPADHEAFETVAELDDSVAALNRELVAARDEFEDDLSSQTERVNALETRFDDIERRLDDTEEKLKRVAWVVSDLRDNQGGRDAHQKAVDRIKRAAAQEGISSASCQNCSEKVEIGLLTDPQCPHCNSTVSDVKPEGGIIRKKTSLITAAQLEAGPTDE
jgi:DNA repair exonuclease SbcCD ATPase subunit